jgi:predicted kinase
MSMAQIYIILGGPAVGKTTTAKQLAAQFSKSLLIHADEIRNMVVSGMELPGKEWSPGLVEQLSLARQSTAYMAQLYQKAGFTVIIDDFWDPHSHMSEYGALLTNPAVCKVILAPSQETAHARNLQRSGPGPIRDYLDAGIHLVYENLNSESVNLQADGWLVLDTSDISTKEIVEHLLEFARERRLHRGASS